MGHARRKGGLKYAENDARRLPLASVIATVPESLVRGAKPLPPKKKKTKPQPRGGKTENVKPADFG